MHSIPRHLLPVCSWTTLCLVICGCSGYTGPRSVLNDDPAVKIPQIRRAVDSGDHSVEPQLVKDLDSNDAAVRFYAIEALARLNGDQRLGYDWTVADRHARAPFIADWGKLVARNAEASR